MESQWACKESFGEGTISNPVDEGINNNPFHEEDEMLDMLNDLQAPIEHRGNEGLKNEISFSIGVDIEQVTTNIFQKLLNKTRSEIYLDCLEFSSLNFLEKLMHVKILNGWSNKSFDMLLELLKAAFPMCSSTISSSFYKAKQKLHDLSV